MRVFLTGAAGFIGFHAARALLDQGHQVLGVDNINSHYDPALKAARLAQLEGRDGFRFARIHVDDAAAVDAALADFRPDLIIHLAALPGIRQSYASPAKAAETDIRSQLVMLELARRLDGARLIYASSSAVYGERADLPFRETDRCDRPLSIYAAAKRSAELLSESYAALYGLPLTGLRLFSVYGPWGRPDMAAWVFTDAILKGEPVRLFNHGRMRRDMTDIRDAVAGLVAMANAPARPGHVVYNVGAGAPVDLAQIVTILETLLDRPATIELAPRQAGDIADTHADISRLAAATGYAPRIPIEQGLADFVAWFRDYRGL